jgi:hypothetical protein
MTVTQEHTDPGPQAAKAQQEIQHTVNQILAAVGGQPQPNAS